LTRQIEGLLEYERPHILIENLLSIRRDPVNGCVYIPFKTKRSRGKPYVVTMERVSYIHPSSLDALIQSIRDRGISIIEGFNAAHSAGLLYGVLFPQTGDKKDVERKLPAIRTRKGLESVREEQEFFVAGIPGVNVIRARSLLKKFGSPSDVVAKTDEWTQVGGIGPKTVAAASKMLFTKYSDNDSNSQSADAESQPTEQP
jgi:ERCC4-type nuclease